MTMETEDGRRKTEETAVAMVPRWEMPAEPSWARARELCGNIRRSIEDIVLLGLELRALRDQWFDHGGSGGDRKSANYRESKINSPQGCGELIEKGRQIEFRDLRGWQRQVQEELGFSDDTARRIMDRAQYVAMLKCLVEGEPVSYFDAAKRQKKIAPTGELSRLAGEALEDVIAGAKSPQRAWAGVVGEGTRRGDGGTRERGEPDYAKQAAPTAVRLRNAFGMWEHLTWEEEQEERAEQAVVTMLAAMPERFRAAMVSIVVEQWSPHEQAAMSKALERARKSAR